ncbi:hypothetical protein OZD68_02455 [Wolbachia endosymbiont of Drosophila bicornuta]|nr:MULTISPECIES: hypothetical protein [Wolbachia]MDE5056453.1 hypothetical protein [Wolbachia endosymbiont of Drosophila bicornuta]
MICSDYCKKSYNTSRSREYNKSKNHRLKQRGQNHTVKQFVS